MRDQTCLITGRETKQKVKNRSQDANRTKYERQINELNLGHHIRYTASSKLMNKDISGITYPLHRERKL